MPRRFGFAAFEDVLRDAPVKSGPLEEELYRRVVQMEDRETLKLWVLAAEATKWESSGA